MDFDSKVKQRLEKYKKARLGVSQKGLYNGKVYNGYDYILPKELQNLNIIETYRKEFFEYLECLENEKRLKLHQYFNHLNSSQAMCFNFFFPFIFEDKIAYLTNLLQIDGTKIDECTFEKVINDKENTNFDFYMEFPSKRKALFEIKYTENGFGSTIDDSRHKNKYEQIYKEMIKDKLNQEYIDNREEFFNNYQILRNISYLNKNNNDFVIFIYPRENLKLKSQLDEVLGKMINKSYLNNIKVFTWEDLIYKVEQELRTSNPIPYRLLSNLELFKEKYL